MSDTGKMIAGILTAIIGVAIVAVLVSANSQTSNVLTAFGGAFGNILDVAVSPVTGNTVAPQVSGGAAGFGGFSGSNGFGNLLGGVGGLTNMLGGSGGMGMLGGIGGMGGIANIASIAAFG